MEIAIVAATAFELAAWGEFSESERGIVGGVGIAQTLETLSGAGPGGLSAFVNIGIAGAYPDTGVSIGDIVIATGENYGDIGFELPEVPGFRAIQDSDFGAFYRESLPCSVDLGGAPLPKKHDLFGIHFGPGVTVNSCAGSEATGVFRRDRFSAIFETMEGAALAQVGRRWRIPVVQIRAVSNVASTRDMRPENIRKAVENLTRYLAAARHGR